MLKLLHDCFEGLGEILESGLGKAFGFVLEGQLHLVLLAKCNDVLLGQRVKVNLRDMRLICFIANIANFRRSCARLETAWLLVLPLADACGFLTMEQRVSTPLSLSRKNSSSSSYPWFSVISFTASAVNPQTDTRNFLMTSFNVTVVRVCTIVESTHLVDGLVWVGLVCRVVFGKLRRPFGSG
jgi:hypothetical protein